MDRRQIGTKLVLDALGLNVKLETFDQRLIIQKAIYLAQAAGIDLGYYYRWYLRGPYSPELASDAFSIASELASDFDESEGWTLDDESRKRLRKLKQILPSKEKRERARQLELLASVHFLVDRRQVRRADPSELEYLLDSYNKDFRGEEIEVAIRSLEDHELL